MSDIEKRIFVALDRQAVPLPGAAESINLDCFCQLLKLDGIADPVEDDEWEAYHDAIYAWAKDRGVTIHV